MASLINPYPSYIQASNILLSETDDDDKIERFTHLISSLDDSTFETLVTHPLNDLRGISVLTFIFTEDFLQLAELIIDRLAQRSPEVSLELKDWSNWTVLHHAALCDQKILYSKLKAFPSAQKLKTDLPYAASPGMCRKITGLAKRTFSDEKCFIYFNNTRMSGKELIDNHHDLFIKKPTHFSLINKMSVEELYKCWYKGIKEPHTSAANLYLHYIDKLRRTHGEEDQFAFEYVEGVGMGVVARKDLPANSVVLYAGEYVKKSDCDHQYALDVSKTRCIDSENVRSVAASINCSFPNAQLEDGFFGIHPFAFARTLREIKAGERISVPYAPRYFGSIIPQEFNRTEMEAFVKQFPLGEFISREQSNQRWMFLLEDASYHTVHLILNGHISIDDAKMLYKKLLQVSQNANSLLRWQDIHMYFTEKVPLEALQECIELMKTKPNEGPALSRQLIDRHLTVENVQVALLAVSMDETAL